MIQLLVALVMLVCLPFLTKPSWERRKILQATGVPLTEADLEDAYYTAGGGSEVECFQKIRLGNRSDGGYYVCDDVDHRPSNPCLVYSFGINSDFSFDDHVSSRYGCEVHSFDPSMQAKDPNLSRLSKAITFHEFGLGDEDNTDPRGWRIKTLTSIKALLNHTKIDILKIDIVHEELKALPNIMASGELGQLQQLLLEIHVRLTDNTTAIHQMREGLKILRSLRDLGFRVFHSQRSGVTNVTSKSTGLPRFACLDLSLVNAIRPK